jgi:hypothetical protein
VLRRHPQTPLVFQEAAQAFTYQGMMFHKQDTEPAALWLILMSLLDHLGHPHAPGARSNSRSFPLLEYTMGLDDDLNCLLETSVRKITTRDQFL